jgi:hypothetical protein
MATEITNTGLLAHLRKGEPEHEPEAPTINLTERKTSSFTMHPHAIVPSAVPEIFSTWRIDIRNINVRVDSTNVSFPKFDPNTFEIFRRRKEGKIGQKI